MGGIHAKIIPEWLYIYFKTLAIVTGGGDTKRLVLNSWGSVEGIEY